MNKSFKKLADYVRLFDGRGKAKLDFQEMYRLFPDLTFVPAKNFGRYENFGEAFEQKVLDTIITDTAGNKAYMVYREYGDADESLAYIS